MDREGLASVSMCTNGMVVAPFALAAELNELEDRWSGFRAIKDFRSLISSSNRSLMASLPA